jgi:transcription termination/antitermination protein NusG
VSTAAKRYEYLASPMHALEEPEWFAIQTRSRHEKKVQTELQYKGLETFLPTVSKLRQWSDRKMRVEFPLFSGYVFVRMLWTPANHLRALNTNGVVTLLGTAGKPTPIPEYQIESTRTLTMGAAPIEVHSFPEVGQRVRVRSGALAGVEGVLLSTNGQSKLVVSIELIQQSLSVSLEGYEVEAVNTVSVS